MVKKDSVRLGRKWLWMQDSAEYGTEAKSRRRVLGVTSRVGVDGDLSSLGWARDRAGCSWRIKRGFGGAGALGGTDPMAGCEQARAMGKQRTEVSLGRFPIEQLKGEEQAWRYRS